MKKYIAYAGVLAIGLGLGLGLTYVGAAYTDPAQSAPGANTPAPILLNDISGSSTAGAFRKLGKLGVTIVGKNVDEAQFVDNSLVIAGQASSQGLAVPGRVDMLAQLPSNSGLNSLFFGDPTVVTGDYMFVQVDGNNKPRLVTVGDHTRVARIVAGSHTASAGNYNLYVEPGDNATNLGKQVSWAGTRTPYCTITANKLESTGCPLGTYLGQIFPETGNAVAGACYDITPGEGRYTTNSHGSCY